MWPSLTDYLWLCLSAFLAGGINALAGGGTLLTFPALTGVLSQSFSRESAKVLANCTSTVALVPASLGSAWGFRRELSALRGLLIWLLPPSLIGGAIGSLLLTRLPAGVFAMLVPWLILTATLVFLLQPLLVKKKSSVATEDGVAAADGGGIDRCTSRALAGMVGLQLIIAIYGGYFGAGIGILMLSGLSLMGLTNIHQMNGLKAVLGTAINGVAVVVFILERKVVWPYALMMMGTSIVAGYLAAHYGRRIPGPLVRYMVVVTGFSLAAWFFAKTYL